MKIRYLAALGAVLITAGCAKNPEAVVPLQMPPNAYAGLTCDQLGSEARQTDAALMQLTADQKQAVTGDAIGVFLIGVPVSSLSGADKEGLLALPIGDVASLLVLERSQEPQLLDGVGLVLDLCLQSPDCLSVHHWPVGGANRIEVGADAIFDLLCSHETTLTDP